MKNSMLTVVLATSMLFGAFVNAAEKIEGKWTLAGDRSCKNGAVINDSRFVNNVSDYSYLIDGSKLTLTMNYQGQPIAIEYTLTEKGDQYLATPKTSANGAGPFDIEVSGATFSALFSDKNHTACGGGQIITPMKK